MTSPPDLRAAARELLDAIHYAESQCAWAPWWWPQGMLSKLEAALAAEEKPKVERVALIAEPIHAKVYRDQGWIIYAEHPIPEKPPEPSIEERLEVAREDEVDYEKDELLREAAAEIRRLRK